MARQNGKNLKYCGRQVMADALLDMNPYATTDSTSEVHDESISKIDEPATSASIRRRFRFRLIPTAVCYLLGGLILAAIPIGIYANFDSVWMMIDVNSPTPHVLLDFLFLVAPVVFSIVGVLRKRTS
jgi:hypothetical protein